MQDKQAEIISMFSEIAPTYDIANRAISFGIDIKWRKIACKTGLRLLAKSKIGAICDVATGTGDMLLFWQKAAQNAGVTVGNYIGVEPASGMIELAKKKAAFATFFQNEATALPIDDSSVDIVSISYGFRNVVDKAKALFEFYRVLNSGGVLVILEFCKSEPKNGLLSKLAQFYVKKILPIFGGLISGHLKAYTYLPSSIDDFLTVEQIVGIAQNAGFEAKFIKDFSFGVSSLLIFQKPSS